MCEGGCGKECKSKDCARRAVAAQDVEATSDPMSSSIRQQEAAIHLAQLLLNMELVTDKGKLAKHLARAVLGISNDDSMLEEIPITTNGNTRWVPPNEPLFLIRGSDILSGSTLRFWAQSAADAGCPKEIVELAEARACLMDAWHTKKLPDLKL